MDDNWCLFRGTLNDLVQEHVPSKQVRGKYRPPWFTQRHERLCRLKERYYLKAKQQEGQKHWDQF